MVDVPTNKNDAGNLLPKDDLTLDSLAWDSMNIINNFTAVMNYLVNNSKDVPDYYDKAHSLNANAGFLTANDSLNNSFKPGLYYWEQGSIPQNTVSINDKGVLLVFSESNGSNSGFSYRIAITGSSPVQIYYCSTMGSSTPEWYSTLNNMDLLNITNSINKAKIDATSNAITTAESYVDHNYYNKAYSLNTHAGAMHIGDNANNYTKEGIYDITSSRGITNLPPFKVDGAADWGRLMVISHAGNGVMQFFFPSVGGICQRVLVGAPASWGPWMMYSAFNM